MAQRSVCFHDPEISECTSCTLAEANEAADRNYAGFRASVGSSTPTALVLMRKESPEEEPLGRTREAIGRAMTGMGQPLGYLGADLGKGQLPPCPAVGPRNPVNEDFFFRSRPETEDETTWGPEWTLAQGGFQGQTGTLCNLSQMRAINIGWPIFDGKCAKAPPFREEWWAYCQTHHSLIGNDLVAQKTKRKVC
jgi:hypothetical protein